MVDHDDVVLVAAPGHSSVNRSGDSPSWAAAPWLITERGCTYRELFEEHVRSRHREVTVAAQTVGLATLRRLASQGHGVAILPTLAAQPELARGELVVLRDFRGSQRIEILALWAGLEPSPPVRALIRRAIDKATGAPHHKVT